MKLVKYALYALAALAILLVVVVAVVLATFDPNDYKPRIVQAVKDKTQRTLFIDGDIELKLFPKIGAELGKITLSERHGSREFAGLERAEIYVALLPLLSRRVIVDGVEVEGLRASLVRFKDGTTNFSDLLEPGPARKPEPKTSDEPAEAVNFNIDSVRVIDSRLSWRDEAKGQDLAIHLQELNTGQIAPGRATPVELKAQIQGAQPKLAVQTALKGTLMFDPVQQHHSVKGLDLKLTGAALDFTGIDLNLRGDFDAQGAQPQIRVSGLTLDGKAARGADNYVVKLSAPTLLSDAQGMSIEKLMLEASGQVAGTTLTQSKLEVPRLQADLAANRILIESLTLAAQGKTAGDAFELQASAPRLQISADSASGESALLTAKLAGAQRNADIRLQLSAIEGSAKALKIAGLTLNIDGRQQDNTVKGVLSTPVLGNLETRVFELPRIVADFVVSGPTLPNKSIKVPLTGAVRADLKSERVAADLLTRFDESNIKAKLGMARFSAPHYDFDVQIDKLNVDKYLPPKPAGAGKSSGDKSAQPEQPIDFSALKALDLNGSLKVGELLVNNIKAAKVRVELRAAGGKLDVSPLAANLYQGTLQGRLQVDANSNRIATKQNLTGISIGPLLRDAVDQDLLEGKGNIALDVVTSGKSVSAFKRALNGSAQLKLHDGAIKGIDLAGAVRKFKATLGAKDAELTANRNEKTDFSELSASFVIRNGVAHNEDLDIKSPFLRISGQGDINVAQDSIDYTVRSAVVGTMKGQGGKDATDLKGLTLPVRIYGPYAALKYKLEFSQMLSGATKQQLDAARAVVKDAAKTQLKDLQKQIFGGGDAQAPAGEEQGQPATPRRRPEDELKDKLKGIFK